MLYTRVAWTANQATNTGCPEAGGSALQLVMRVGVLFTVAARALHGQRLL